MADDRDEKPPRHFLIERALENRIGGRQSLRSAARHGSYLLPYLQPVDCLLDVGCGPGAITKGFAEYLREGTVTGVDRNPEQITTAKSGTLPGNLTFSVADVYDLPFEDGTFDAVHAHALFQHLGEPDAACKELYRVLRPGGVIGLGDWDKQAVLMHPANETLLASLSWLQTFHNQANAYAGRELAELMQTAGFHRSAMSVIAEGMSEENFNTWLAENQAKAFEDEETITGIAHLGLATSQTLEALPDLWRSWGREPGAIFVTHWFHSVAFRPA